MPTLRIQDAADPRIQSFLSLRARTERGEPLLIADGRRVLVNLLRTNARIESVFCEEHALEDTAALLAERQEVPIYSAPAEVVERVVGYRYHRGVMASVAHPGTVALAELGLRIVVLDGLDKGENVGAVIRNCAAFGVDSIVVGPGSATPFQRNAIRASRGFVFRMKVHESLDLQDTLARLKDRGYPVVATNQARDAMPYHQAPVEALWALVFGNEGHGLSASVQAKADRRVTIPMAEGADSLNVAAASAVILSDWFLRK